MAARNPQHLDRNTECDLYKVYNLVRNCFKMIHDRGYYVSQEELDKTYAMWKDQYKDRLGIIRFDRACFSIMAAHTNDPTDKIWVVTPGDANMGVKRLRSYVTKMQDEGISRLVLVTPGSLTPTATMCIKELASPRFKSIIEHFVDQELMYNLVDHQLVPEIDPISKDEIAKICHRYHIRPHHLPQMQVTDPLSRYYGLRRGEAVRVTRTSESAGRCITYRIIN